MNTTEITTLEPITINLTEADYGHSVVKVYVDGIHYMLIEHCDINDIDFNRVRHFVENTYYDNCYQSSQYTAGTYSNGEFLYV